jgi:hypothetical protein
MVENVFLDHLKADSEERRKQDEELKESGFSPYRWTQEEDDYLIQNVLKKTDEEFEADLKSKSKSAILKRRKYLGLIRPKIIKRTSHHRREQRLVFKLDRGQRFFMNMEIAGGNKDIEFSVTDLKTYQIGTQRICGTKNIEFTPEVSGNYSFCFSNAFSLITSKKVTISYHLENGREIRILVEL